MRVPPSSSSPSHSHHIQHQHQQSQLRARSHSLSQARSTSHTPSQLSANGSANSSRSHKPSHSHTHSPKGKRPQRNSHPVKNFLLPQGLFAQIASLPAQILFALLGMMGIAHYARQIVRVRPRAPGTISLKPSASTSASSAKAADTDKDIDIDESAASAAASASGAGSASETEAGTLRDADGHEVSVDQWIVKNTPSLNGSYVPSWWLPNGHLQTFYIVTGDFTKSDHVDYVRTLLRVPDGGTLALDITPPNHESLPKTAPTVLVCHGLTGNANESYVRNVLAWVAKPKSEGGLGGRGVVINFRGCGGTPMTSTQMYSAAASCDPNTAAHYLRATYPESAIHGVGFSLGAGVLARYLGERGDSSLLSSGCVLGCPWNTASMAAALEEGWFSSRVYSRALGQNLVRMFFRAYDSNPAIFEADDSRCKDVLEDMRRLRKLGGKVRLRMVDEILTSKIGGPLKPYPFDGADAYYAYASSDKLIRNVKVPLLGINAFDDPVIHGESLPITEVTDSSHVHLAVTGGGGHLGWFDGPLWGTQLDDSDNMHPKTRTSRWVRRPIAEFLTAAARDLAPRATVPTVKEADGWVYVDGPPMSPQTGADPVRIGWKVIEKGRPLVSLAQPAIQGL